MQWMQLDQNGDANSWSLGEFLAQDEVRVMMLDPACTKSLTFREFVNGRLRSRTPDNWTGAPAAEDDGSLDDIPSSTDAFTAAGPGPSSAASDGLHVIEVQKRWLPQLTHPNLSALGTEPTEPSRMPASRAAPRSPAETGSARRVAARRR